MKTLRWGLAASALMACAVVAANGGDVLKSVNLNRGLKPASEAATLSAGALSVGQRKASKMKAGLLDMAATAAASPAMTLPQLKGQFPAMAFSAGNNGPMVTLNLTARRNPAAFASALRSLGATQISTYGRVVSAHLPVTALGAMDKMSDLLEARPALATTNRGAFVTQGDFALGAPQIRPPAVATGRTGAGLRIGVLSDSFNCLTTSPTAADDVATGENDPVDVLKDLPGCGGSDEGRAMVQLVADVAPGTKQSFYTAFDGEADFANGIVALADAGANIVVDDVIYFDEPFFQDGIVAQAADAVVARGVPYFSSAGNQARASYESVWRSGSGALVEPTSSGPQFNFDPNGNVTRQQVTINRGATLRLALQWDEPYASTAADAPGSASDIDVYLVDAAGNVVAASAANNLGGDPFEFLNYTNTTAAARTLFLVIEVFSGPVPGRIKYINYGSSSVAFAFATNSGTAIGHTAAAGVFSAGAAPFFNTRACYGGPTVLESFSSRGGTPILRNASGARLPAPIVRQKPDAVGPDGGNTSFFIQVFNVPASARPIPECQDTDGLPNNFFGTSAAAPHLAAVAALLKEAAPFATVDQIYSAMRSTAEDMGTPGVDFDSGYGFVQAPLALTAAVDTTPDPFAFNDVSVRLPLILVPSNPVRITGITAYTPIAISGNPLAVYSVNGGPFTRKPGLVGNNDRVRLLQLSPLGRDRQSTAILTVGGTSASWTITTSGLIRVKYQN